MTRSSMHIKDFSLWGITALAGAVWGAGLSRTLAQEFTVPFFAGEAGVFFSAAAGAILIILVAFDIRSKGVDPVDTAQQFLPLFLPLIDIFSVDPHPWRGPVLLVISACLVLLQKVKLGRAAGFWLAVLIPLLIYLPDISPYVGRADTFEFQVVAPNLGIAHPSGYPLYVLIGKIFSWIPISTMAWRINLSSGVLAALTSGVLYLTVTGFALSLPDSSVVKHQQIAGLLTALTLAFSPTLWSRAVEAEVYALNACIVSLVLWVASLWFAARLSAKRALPVLGLLTGLAIASHLTLGALAGIVVMVAAAKRKDLNWRVLLFSGILAIAGLTLYLMIPLRWPAVTGGEVMSLEKFSRFVTNADSGGALLPRAFLDDPTRWRLVFRLLRQQVGWAGLALSTIGFITLVIRSRLLALGTLLAFSAWIWFNLSFYVAEPDYSAFLVPAHVILVFWFGAGLLALLHLLALHVPWAMPACLVLVALLPSSRLWVTGPTLDTQSLGYRDETWGRYVLGLPLADEAVILADSVKFPPLYYLQQVEHIRPDVTLVTLFDEPQYRNALVESLSTGKAVYLARYLPGMDEYGVSSLGSLVRVAPDASNTDSGSLNIIFGNKLMLRDFTLEPDPEGRALHHLTLDWLVIDDIHEDLEVRLRLITLQDNHIVWENEPARPVNGYSSTTAWLKGTAVDDYYSLEWPAWLPPNTYHLEMGLFPRFGQEALWVEAENDDWFALKTQEFGSEHGLPTSIADLQTPKHVLYGDGLWMLGVDVYNEVLAGSTTLVDVTWACDTPLSDLWVPQFIWIASDSITSSPATAYEQSTGESGALNITCNGQSVVRRYHLSTPTVPGDYNLEMALRNPQGDANPARCQWLRAPESLCLIAQVTTIPSNTDLANYDNRLLLLDAELEPDAIPAGGPLSVSLLWRGLRSLDKDYTMFLQIIGPDGTLYGQVDSWPQQGGRPTSGWGAGEEIRDHYTLFLKQDAPPGQYSVILGWYLLADMHRLPLVTDTGQTVNDFQTLGTFKLLPDGSVE